MSLVIFLPILFFAMPFFFFGGRAPLGVRAAVLRIDEF
jgi:hypothetical protein